MKCRAGQLRAALQLYQQAAGINPEEEGKQEGTSCAEAVAEASLKLAFLCNDLLQVGIAHSGDRAHDIDHVACILVLDATGTVSSCRRCSGPVLCMHALLLVIRDDKSVVAALHP